MHRSWNDTTPVLRRARRDRSRQAGSALFRIVVEVVANAFRIGVDELSRPTRGSAHVALARQVAMYLTSVMADLDHAAVGRLFQRDRTTVAHACIIVMDRCDDPRFDRTLSLLEGIVRRTCDVSNGAAQHCDCLFPLFAPELPDLHGLGARPGPPGTQAASSP